MLLHDHQQLFEVAVGGRLVRCVRGVAPLEARPADALGQLGQLLAAAGQLLLVLELVFLLVFVLDLPLVQLPWPPAVRVRRGRGRLRRRGGRVR